jgi:hypothetical protein
MANRRERRATASQSRKVAFQLSSEEKRDLARQLLARPGYVADTQRLVEAFELWQRLHPMERPVWQDTEATLVMGGAIDDEHMRGYIAGNDAAHRCLLWVDEHTGKMGTLMQVQFVLSHLGWTTPPVGAFDAFAAGTGSRAFRALERAALEHCRPGGSVEGRVPDSPCGHCGLELGRATHVDGWAATPGQLAVCRGCAGVNRFGADMSLVKVSDEELPGFDVDHAELEEMRALIRAAGTGGSRRGGNA